MAAIEGQIHDNPRLEQAVIDHYSLPDDSDVRTHLQFILAIRRKEAKVKLYAASRLTFRDGFVLDLADFYGEPRRDDELGAIAHFLDIHPNDVEPSIEAVRKRLGRPRRRNLAKAA